MKDNKNLKMDKFNMSYKRAFERAVQLGYVCPPASTIAQSSRELEKLSKKQGQFGVKNIGDVTYFGDEKVIDKVIKKQANKVIAPENASEQKQAEPVM